MDNCMTGWWLGTLCNLCVENETDICKTFVDWNIYSAAFSDVWNIIWTIQLGLVLGNPVLVIMDNLIFTGENRVVWRMYLLTLDKGLMLPHIRTFMMNKICKLILMWFVSLLLDWHCPWPNYIHYHVPHTWYVLTVKWFHIIRVSSNRRFHIFEMFQTLTYMSNVVISLRCALLFVCTNVYCFKCIFCTLKLNIITFCNKWKPEDGIYVLKCIVF